MGREREEGRRGWSRDWNRSELRRTPGCEAIRSSRFPTHALLDVPSGRGSIHGRSRPAANLDHYSTNPTVKERNISQPIFQLVIFCFWFCCCCCCCCCFCCCCYLLLFNSRSVALSAPLSAVRFLLCWCCRALLRLYRPASALSSFIYPIMTFHQADLLHLGCSHSTLIFNNLIRSARRQQQIPWGFSTGEFDMEDYIYLQNKARMSNASF